MSPQLGTAGLPAVHAVYQPIVDLVSGATVSYEALVRGPRGGELESPSQLFAAARESGLEGWLDLECRAAALRGALERRLPASVPLFINAEPRWLPLSWPKPLEAILDQARRRLQIVVEITERTLVDDPAALFGAVRELRDLGMGIALDDVGAVPESLALMPLIDPDVIKLDLALVQEHDRPDVAAIVNAVAAQAERSGALVLAEGIETPEHTERALAMGATLGQGWLLGRPSALPDRLPGSHAELTISRPWKPLAATPFEQIRRVRPTRPVTKGLLLPMSHHLERHALRTTVKPVLLATFENQEHFTADTAERYEKLARHCSFVGALGAGMDTHPVPGVRGGDLAPDDELAGEWVVCVLGPHFAGALVAKDLNDTGPDRDRRFEAAITYDRALVIDIARVLMGRIGKN